MLLLRLSRLDHHCPGGHDHVQPFSLVWSFMAELKNHWRGRMWKRAFFTIDMAAAMCPSREIRPHSLSCCRCSEQSVAPDLWEEYPAHVRAEESSEVLEVLGWYEV